MPTLAIKQFPFNAPPKSIERIAEQYASAIVRRGREATNPDFLAYVWRTNCAHFVRQGRNFLILRKVGQIYVATHFAPHTLKGGHRLLKAVKDAGLPICFAVPDDLAQNLSRIGWVSLPDWANKLAVKKGLPDEKKILVPSGLVKTAWKIFRAGDYCAQAEENDEVIGINYRRRAKAKGPAKVLATRQLKRDAQVWTSATQIGGLVNGLA